MLNTKNSTQKIVVILSLVLLLAGFVITALVAAKAAYVPRQIACLFYFAALIYAAYYILSGYGKNASKYYKLFAGIFALALLASLAAIGASSVNYFESLFSALAFSIVVVLALGQNLGKTISLSLCAALIVCCAVLLILSLNSDLLLSGAALTKLILALVTTVMTVAKYIDKTARGSK